MYKIAICEDDAIFANSLAQTSREVLGEMGIPFSIDFYTGGEELMQVITGDTSQYQLLLLDILMDGMNGLELARRIRAAGGEMTLVFITGTEAFSLQGYEVRAHQYLLKPVRKADLRKIFEYDHRQLYRHRFITIRQGAVWRKVSMEDILYLETHGRKVAVYLAGEMIFYPGKLSELEMQLPGNIFIRCHQSFTINIQTISEIRRNEAFWPDGRSVPISRAHLQQVQSAFLKQLGEM